MPTDPGGPQGPPTSPQPSGQPSGQPPADHAAELAFWRDAALTEPDTGFCILDASARILFASAVAGELLLGAPSTAMLSLGLREIFAPDLAAERITYVDRLLRHHRPLIVGEVWRGVRCRSIWRLLPLQAGARHEVLWTIRPAPVPVAIDQPVDADVIEAIHHEWGPLAPLTALQRRILGMVAAGFEPAQIAAVTGLPLADVNLQRLAIERLLHTSNPAVLVRRAVIAGLTGV